MPTTDRAPLKLASSKQPPQEDDGYDDAMEAVDAAAQALVQFAQQARTSAPKSPQPLRSALLDWVLPWWQEYHARVGAAFELLSDDMATLYEAVESAVDASESATAVAELRASSVLLASNIVAIPELKTLHPLAGTVLQAAGALVPADDSDDDADGNAAGDDGGDGDDGEEPVEVEDAPPAGPDATPPAEEPVVDAPVEDTDAATVA